jgi:hypothetical protein
MPSSWAGFGKSPITVIKEALTDKFIQGREVNSNVINYSIFIDIADEERDLTVGVLDQHNSLFFVVDLQIDCPDDQEVIANVAEATYELYAGRSPSTAEFSSGKAKPITNSAICLAAASSIRPWPRYSSTWSKRKFWKSSVSASP